MKRREFLAWASASAALPARAAEPPLLALAQYNAPPDTVSVRTYLDALRELGLVEGKTVRIERRYAHGDSRRLPAMAAEIASLRPALMFALGHDISKAAKEQGTRFAIVTSGSEDPVLSGLVQSIARPGGNITGVTFMSPQVAGKRLELLKLAVPGLTRVAVLWDPSHFDTYYRDMGAPAAALGVKLQSFQVRSASDIEAAVALAAASGEQAIFLVPSRTTLSGAARVAQLCQKARLPAMSAYASFAEAGGLLAYGADVLALMRSAAIQTRKILSGTRPAEIPVEQAQSFLLTVNLKAAAAMGHSLPPELLLRADRVIE